jgi:hypothetical protein
MVKLLEGRRDALEAAIASKFREARESGATANVRAMSSELRAVKLQLAATRDAGGEVPGVCHVCGSDRWLTAKWVRGDRTICGPCLAKAKKASSTA